MTNETRSNRNTANGNTRNDSNGKTNNGKTNGGSPGLMSVGSLLGNQVFNLQKDDLGGVKEIMLDMHSGQVAYVVLSFGGMFGMGEKLFAVPWNSLKLNRKDKCFTLDADKDKLKNAPGFDTDHWPDMADETWGRQIHSYYGTSHYSESLNR